MLHVCSRSQTQHQYKLKELLQEIRDLESDEMQFDSGCLPPTPECGEPTDENSAKPHDHSLFGLLQSELSGSPSATVPDKEEESHPQQNLSDILDNANADGGSIDTQSDKWDQFSLFVGAEESPVASIDTNEESDGVWGDELSHNTSQLQTEFQQEIDELLAMDGPSLLNPSPNSDSLNSSSSQSIAHKDMVFDPLESSDTATSISSSLHDLKLDSANTSQQSLGQPLLDPLLPASDNSKAFSTGPPPKPAHDKAAKTGSTSWMNVFAHLDPIANEKV